MAEQLSKHADAGQSSSDPDSEGVAVSIIIPAYNAEAFLADALNSVAEQSFQNFECLIIDDASTDGSRSIIRRFSEADSRFRGIELTRNAGASAARNVGLAEASGRWVALLDADDLFLPDRLDRLIDTGERWSADLVIDDLLITAFPSRTPQCRAFAFTAGEAVFTQEQFFRSARLFTRRLPAGYVKPLMRRRFLQAIGASYDPQLSSGEDFVFYAQLLASGARCVSTSYSGYVYRRRPGSLSKSEDHLHVHARLSDRIMDEQGSSLSEQSRTALIQRKRDFQLISAAAPALAALRERRWLNLLSLLAKSPQTVLTFARLVWARTGRTSGS